MTTAPDVEALPTGATFSPDDDAWCELVNIAPMGPIVDVQMRRLVLRPFTSSTTYQNLKATGQGVFHVTDDALLIARAAIGRMRAAPAGRKGIDDGGAVPVLPADVVRGVVLTDACRYYEFRVTSLDDLQPRTRIEAQVVHQRRLRDFFGFNRGKHAVVEAAILTTRVHLTGPQPVLDELDRLRVLVDKTGGAAEHRAMRELRDYVEQANQAIHD